MYYILLSNKYKILETHDINELISYLYEGIADFISENQRIELNLPDNYFKRLKKRISKFTQRVPMYDINTNQIYLINKENVYERLSFDNYRFITEKFSLELNDKFLSYYDMNELYNTYTKIFYESFILNSFITTCRRPSFKSKMEHISPYYTINELNYLAYDWNLTNKPTLNEKELDNLCNQISKYDISSETLIDHQIYIYNSNAIGLVKHYSLFGSYYMNLYLRKYVNSDDFIVNSYLNNQIKIMINLIKNAPSFTNSYTVYRFIENDNYMKHLKINDIYQDSSFMSTTRNPFYYKENYAFGYILIKIKLPKNIKGIGLSIEAYSNFPNEEEIILPPKTKYKLDNLLETENIIEFHNIFNLKIQKKYEMSWVSNDYTNLNIKGFIPELKNIDLKNLIKNEDIKLLSIPNRLEYFRKNFINLNNQFSSTIMNNTYIFNMESYDSTSVYKQFFYYKVKNGLMITTSNPKFGNINIILELGIDIHVNYYFKYSITDPSIVVDLNRSEWIEWLSLLAYIIGSQNIIIHSNYELLYNKNDTIQDMKTRYTVSQNIYEYMKYKKKFFVYPTITTKFDYYQLDRLFTIPTNDLIKSTDKNELYKLSKNKENLGDFYLYIVENYPKLIKLLEEKLSSLYENNNPFDNIEYQWDAWTYLYNNNLINQVPLSKEFKKGSYQKLIGDKKIPKFKNRLRTYLLAQ